MAWAGVGGLVDVDDDGVGEDGWIGPCWPLLPPFNTKRAIRASTTSAAATAPAASAARRLPREGGRDGGGADWVGRTGVRSCGKTSVRCSFVPVGRSARFPEAAAPSP